MGAIGDFVSLFSESKCRFVFLFLFWFLFFSFFHSLFLSFPLSLSLSPSPLPLSHSPPLPSPLASIISEKQPPAPKQHTHHLPVLRMGFNGTLNRFSFGKKKNRIIEEKNKRTKEQKKHSPIPSQFFHQFSLSNIHSNTSQNPTSPFCDVCSILFEGQWGEREGVG